MKIGLMDLRQINEDYYEVETQTINGELYTL